MALLLLTVSACQSRPTANPDPLPSPTPPSVGQAEQEPTATPLSAPVAEEEPSTTDSEVQVERPPDESMTLAPGATIRGDLRVGSGTLTDGTAFHAYEFTGEPGHFITITLASSEFDTYLLLVGPDGVALSTNDDANPKANTDSRLALALPQAGRYQLWVNTFEGAGGAYTLEMVEEDRTKAGGTLTADDPQQGWLLPGDPLTASGFYYDEWHMEMGSEPLLVWLESQEFDPYLHVEAPNGNLLIDNDDINFVAGDGNARVLLAPTEEVPAGTPLTLVVTFLGTHAIGGTYHLRAAPLPPVPTEQATLQVQPLVVRGPNGAGGPAITDEQIGALIEQASQTWQQCGITVTLAESGIRSVEVAPELAEQVTVGEGEWTEDEFTLQSHPARPPYDSRLITAYFVKTIDGGERYGVAYPSTRFPASRSGVMMLTEAAVLVPEQANIFAHEIGHLLGLEHPNDITGDGDPWNDTPTNLMRTDQPGTEVTPLQCLTARGDPHYLATADGAPLTPPDFQHQDRVLLPGERIVDTLSTQNAMEGGTLLDVFYFYGRKGETVRLTLTATGFDPVLLVDGPDGQRLAEDDDSGGGTAADLTLTLPADGDYSVGVTGYQWGTGRYELVRVE